jgi:hypothetical protein
MLPHRPRRTARIIALALAVSSAAAPASARVFNQNAQGSLVFPQQTSSAPSVRPNPGQQTLPGPAPTIVRVTVPTGFDWGDAGIGAAGGFALAMVGLGGTLALSQRRARHPNGPPAPTS